MSRYFHFTTEENWGKIEKEGLIPMPFTESQRQPWSGYDLADRGVWLWKSSDDEVFFDAFINRMGRFFLGDVGVLLRVMVDRRNLLSERIRKNMKMKVELLHRLAVTHEHYGTRVIHRDKPFDVCLVLIPPEKIRLIKKIKIVIEKIGR